MAALHDNRRGVGWEATKVHLEQPLAVTQNGLIDSAPHPAPTGWRHPPVRCLAARTTITGRPLTSKCECR